MIRLAVVCVGMLALAGCAQMERACEDVEPFRPLIRGAITAVEPVAAIPFAVTRNIRCADIEALVNAAD